MISLFILAFASRHYFHLQGLTEEEIQSIKVYSKSILNQVFQLNTFQVAACEGSGSNFNGISSQNIIMSDAPVQSTIVETKKSMSRKQSSKLLGQMESVVGSQKVDKFLNISFTNPVLSE